MVKKKRTPEEDYKYRVGQIDDNGRKICGAEIRSTGNPCRGIPMQNGRCVKHGGPSPKGILGSRTVNGRDSKYLPKRLLDRYHEFIGNEDILSLNSEIALLDTRISEMLERIDVDAASPEAWIELSKLWGEFMFAVRTGNSKEQNKLLLIINNAIEKGSDQEKLWNNIITTVEGRRKLSDTERKRLTDMQQMVTVEQALLLVTTTVIALKEAVYKYADPKAAREIIVETSGHYQRLIGDRSPETIDQ